MHRVIKAALGAAAAISLGAGCARPDTWDYTGPRVYLIEGDALDESDGLTIIRDALHHEEVAARIYGPDNWLDIVRDIDARPHGKVILVGHGHGGFLATQIVRHYAQRHKAKVIDAVFTIDAFNKDWPHTDAEAGFVEPHERPMPIPIGHNAMRVRNYVQSNPESRRWGADLVSTRGSRMADWHPFYWYDHWWHRCLPYGQLLGDERTNENVWHETIDNDAELIERIIRMCRRAALSPYHYTPPEHHPDVKARQEQTPPTALPRRAT